MYALIFNTRTYIRLESLDGGAGTGSVVQKVTGDNGDIGVGGVNGTRSRTRVVEEQTGLNIEVALFDPDGGALPTEGVVDEGAPHYVDRAPLIPKDDPSNIILEPDLVEGRGGVHRNDEDRITVTIEALHIQVMDHRLLL